MRRSRFIQPIRLIAGLSTVLIFAILAVPLSAETAHQPHAGQGIGPVYDIAHEITLNGTIQTVVTKRTKGSPAGMRLLVMGPEGIVDAHVGLFLSKTTKEALQEGTPVRIVGAMTSQHGKTYLMARELTVNNRTVTVRSPHGLPASVATGHKVRARSEKKSAVEANGGAR